MFALGPTGSALGVPGCAPFPVLATLGRAWGSALAIAPQTLVVVGTHITAGFWQLLWVSLMETMKLRGMRRLT